jgi:hypothetical protein
MEKMVYKIWIEALECVALQYLNLSIVEHEIVRFSSRLGKISIHHKYF